MKGITTDTEKGIRTIREIEKLPVNQLRDDEIVKLFFKRFDANALVCIYQEKNGASHILARLRRKKSAKNFIYQAYRFFGRMINATVKHEYVDIDTEGVEDGSAKG